MSMLRAPSRGVLFGQAPGDGASDAGRRSESVGSRASAEDAAELDPTGIDSAMDILKRLRFWADVEAGMALAGLAASVLQHQMNWAASTAVGVTGIYCDPDASPGCDPRDQAAFWPPAAPSFSSEAVRVVGSVLTAGAIGACLAYYQALLRSKMAKNLVPPSATLLGSSLGLPVLLECLCLLAHPFPFITSLGLPDPGLYLALVLIPLLRCAIMLRVVRFHSPLNSSNGRFIGALTNVEFDGSFILKTVLKERPVSVLLLTLGGLVLASSFAIHVIESVECAFYRSLGCAPLTFLDSVWLVVITGLTIGFGDVTASTVGGRAVTVVGGLLGTLLTAVTIALTTEYLQLSRSESKVVTFLAKHRQRQRLQVAAADLLQAAWRWRVAARVAAAASGRRDQRADANAADGDAGRRGGSQQRKQPARGSARRV
ncbi:hypothetical protein FNF31_03389 [Cafeteria roenbergensis]|uniref:Potassium channel domain-containing protein n=1 Tax=Cafeteria roenbergensis TaxID=33653 RepID=A0A5A8DC24_CAFRO|nr:hypothetical protein FNF31_03389 [Cafeteria roenbergensis]